MTSATICTMLCTMLKATIRNRWVLFPIVSIGAAVAFAVLTVTLAVANHPLGVEPNYDSKAANYQATVEQRATNDRLRWLVTPGLVRMDQTLASITLRVEDRHTIPIDDATISVECIPLVNGDARQSVELIQLSPGTYAGTFEVAAEGKHEFRVRILQGLDTYTDRFRRPIPALGSTQVPP